MQSYRDRPEQFFGRPREPFTLSEMDTLKKLGIPGKIIRGVTGKKAYLVSTEELGKGAFGTVYKGYDEDRNIYAIKKLKPKPDKLEYSQIQNEILVLMHVREEKSCHPSIVCIYDYYLSSSGSVYIIMEYVDGGTFKRLPADLSKRIFIYLLTGLQHIHSQGILHRDIKPDNILITKDNQMKITDFGVACALTAVTNTIRSCRGIAGTYRYMDPRVYVETGEEDSFEYERPGLTYSSDIYSLGATLTMAILGQYPVYKDTKMKDCKIAYQDISNKLREKDLC